MCRPTFVRNEILGTRAAVAWLSPRIHNLARRRRGQHLSNKFASPIIAVNDSTSVKCDALQGVQGPGISRCRIHDSTLAPFASAADQSKFVSRMRQAPPVTKLYFAMRKVAASGPVARIRAWLQTSVIV